jgi:hypothetical protein
MPLAGGEWCLGRVTIDQAMDAIDRRLGYRDVEDAGTSAYPRVYVCGARVLSRPSNRNAMTLAGVALVGEACAWAAGHIEKERTRSNASVRGIRAPDRPSWRSGLFWPRVSRWPLWSRPHAADAVAAIRTEKRADAVRWRIPAYRAGAAPVARAFSLARVRANREYRAVLGLVAAWRSFYSECSQPRDVGRAFRLSAQAALKGRPTLCAGTWATAVTVNGTDRRLAIEFETAQ